MCRTLYQVKKLQDLVTLVSLVMCAALSYSLSTRKGCAAGPAGSPGLVSSNPVYAAIIENVSKASCDTLWVPAGPDKQTTCTQVSRKHVSLAVVSFPLLTASSRLLSYYGDRLKSVDAWVVMSPGLSLLHLPPQELEISCWPEDYVCVSLSPGVLMWVRSRPECRVDR